MKCKQRKLKKLDFFKRSKKPVFIKLPPSFTRAYGFSLTVSLADQSIKSHCLFFSCHFKQRKILLRHPCLNPYVPTIWMFC